MDSKPLYLITDGGALRHAGRLVRAVERALSGATGRVFAVQLREQRGCGRDATDDELRTLIKELRPLCRAHEAHLILNRRLDLAGEFGLGVHLGVHSATIDEARSALSAGSGQASREGRIGAAVIGYSAHTAEEIRQLASTYFFYSPVFNPLSKQSDRPPLGVDGFQAGVAQTPVPVFALGGITPDNIGGVRRAGAAGGAVITSVLLAPAPDEAAKRFLDAWDEAIK